MAGRANKSALIKTEWRQERCVYMARAVCKLSAGEAFRLEHRGQRPDCRHHRHETRDYASALVDAENFRWVGDQGRAITRVEAREWGVALSDGCCPVMQLLPIDLNKRTRAERKHVCCGKQSVPHPAQCRNVNEGTPNS